MSGFLQRLTQRHRDEATTGERPGEQESSGTPGSRSSFPTTLQNDAGAQPAASVVPHSPLDGADAIFADLDGVVYRGPEPVSDAVESLNLAQRTGLQVSYLTNNASRTPKMVADQLNAMGLHVAENDIVTSPQAAVPLLADHIAPGSEVLVVGGVGLLEAVQQAGYHVTRTQSEQTAAVVQGFAKDVSWADLAEAAYAVAAGAVWIGTNQDWTLPNERGLAPGNGTLLSAVHTATGTFPTIAGKPERPIFDVAVTRFRAAQPLFIGDRLDTDIEGARRVGITSAHVLTGVDQAREIIEAAPERRPDFLLQTLADLHRPYPVLEIAPNGAVSGHSVVRIDGADVIIERGDPSDIDTLRAAAAAVWECSIPVSALRLPEDLVGPPR
ncbi:MAG: HAD-IIA family hydrolase [Pseudoclavibacter sp.]